MRPRVHPTGQRRKGKMDSGKRLEMRRSAIDNENVLSVVKFTKWKNKFKKNIRDSRKKKMDKVSKQLTMSGSLDRRPQNPFYMCRWTRQLKKRVQGWVCPGDELMSMAFFFLLLFRTANARANKNIQKINCVDTYASHIFFGKLNFFFFFFFLLKIYSTNENDMKPE